MPSHWWNVRELQGDYSLHSVHRYTVTHLCCKQESWSDPGRKLDGVMQRLLSSCSLLGSVLLIEHNLDKHRPLASLLSLWRLEGKSRKTDIWLTKTDVLLLSSSKTALLMFDVFFLLFGCLLWYVCSGYWCRMGVCVPLSKFCSGWFAGVCGRLSEFEQVLEQ